MAKPLGKFTRQNVDISKVLLQHNSLTHLEPHYRRLSSQSASLFRICDFSRRLPATFFTVDDTVKLFAVCHLLLIKTCTTCNLHTSYLLLPSCTTSLIPVQPNRRPDQPRTVTDIPTIIVTNTTTLFYEACIQQSSTIVHRWPPQPLYRIVK